MTNSTKMCKALFDNNQLNLNRRMSYIAMKINIIGFIPCVSKSHPFYFLNNSSQTDVKQLSVNQFKKIKFGKQDPEETCYNCI